MPATPETFELPRDRGRKMALVEFLQNQVNSSSPRHGTAI
jgi:hypothetical protein